MAVDLNKAAEKLKSQENLGATKDGQILDKDPRNDGTRANSNGNTSFKPRRFYRA